MAKVNLNWEAGLKKCPERVNVTCSAHSERVLVSGDKLAIKSFINKLKEEGVLAEEVSDMTALHSYFITIIAGQLKTAMGKAIEKPAGMRSSWWLSTSVPESHWQTDLAKTASAG